MIQVAHPRTTGRSSSFASTLKTWGGYWTKIRMKKSLAASSWHRNKMWSTSRTLNARRRSRTSKSTSSVSAGGIHKRLITSWKEAYFETIYGGVQALSKWLICRSDENRTMTPRSLRKSFSAKISCLNTPKSKIKSKLYQIVTTLDRCWK